MKFSQETLKILKNFSTINTSLLFTEGNVLKTVNGGPSVFATATITETIPGEAGIYDLPKFISTLSLFKEPDIEFNGTHLLIKEENRKTKYACADKSLLIIPPEKNISFPNPDVEVTLNSDDLDRVMKAAGVLRLPDVAFVGEEGKCYIRAMNANDSNADVFGIEIGETNDEFTLLLKTENMIMMKADYEVMLSSKGISKFKSENVEYIIAVDKNSKYKKGE